MGKVVSAEVIIIGGGLAGLSAAIYLGRALRDTLVVDSGKSMAKWEPDVQNYLGFPKGIDGAELLAKACAQARRYGTRFQRDVVRTARRVSKRFSLKGNNHNYDCACLLLCTGVYHVPPDIPKLKPCLGHSMFFCKDCDGYRVQGKSIGIYGWSNETVRYALSMLLYSACVVILTDGKPPKWDNCHAKWLKEYDIPVYSRTIVAAHHGDRRLRALCFAGGTEIELDALFITRGDIYFNKLAKTLGAQIDEEGQIVVDIDMRTSVRGLYSAGCVTPANCQMIIAAGQGATAAQAINRDLFCESLKTHSLRRFRQVQLRKKRTKPTLRSRNAF